VSLQTLMLFFWKTLYIYFSNLNISLFFTQSYMTKEDMTYALLLIA